MAVLHKIKATAQTCTRGSFSLLAAAVMVFAAGASAQNLDTAYVPFRVNVDATATAQLASGEKFEKLVRAGSTDTLHIISESTTPVISSKVPKPVAMHSSRGKISLELSRQSYKGVDIALYSLDGKQIMHARADASETIKSISHPNIRMGVYVLSVKGISGSIFTTRLTHSGGGMNIDVAFAGENISSASPMEKALPGDWTITVSAEGHLDTSYAFVPETGRGKHSVHHITLRQAWPYSSSAEDEPSSSSAVVLSSSSLAVVPSSSSVVVVPSSSSVVTPSYSSAVVVSSSSSFTVAPSSSSVAVVLSSSSVVALSSSSMVAPSSSSAVVVSSSSSVAVVPSSSSVAVVLSSSSVVALSSSSMVTPSYSSAVVVSSSSSVAVVPSSSSAVVIPSSSSAEDEPSSSSSLPVSSSSAEPLTCGSVPVLGYATIPITPPALTCGNGGTATSVRWLGSPAINWNNPKEGTYSGISVMANCGTATNLIASCPGTLAVRPMISCSMVGTGYEGVAITPAIACSDGSEPFDIVFSGYLPNLDNPALGDYAVFAEADCGHGTTPTVFCGTLKINPATLTCGSVPASVYEGAEITPPALTCNNGKTATDITWSANAPNWSNPATGTYSSISTTANCGSVTRTASCNGTLTVNPATLICGSVPADGFSGFAITPPALTCNNGKTATDITWSANAPNWSNPATGTYSGISAMANCGSVTKTASCSGSLQVYKIVTIGTQTWMAENLNYNTSGSKCYDNLESNCNTYGRLYDWSTAMNLTSSCNSSTCSSLIKSPHRGICPAGWHIPSDADWDALMTVVGDSAGTKLKTVSGWNNFNGASGNGTDEFGFSALPGGLFTTGFVNVGYHGFWWSATENGASDAYDWNICYYLSYIQKRGGDGKSSLFSVRCVHD